MDIVLASLLLDLSNLSDKEAEEKTFQEYVRLYTDRETYKGMIGVRKTHDGEDVIFYEWRFDHAFFESAYKTSRKYNKGKFAMHRATRIQWIGEIISGNVDGCEFCDFPNSDRRDSSGRIIIQRIYIVREENYIIWLEPHQKGGWWFSTAYVANEGYIRRITKGCHCKKISRD